MLGIITSEGPVLFDKHLWAWINGRLKRIRGVLDLGIYCSEQRNQAYQHLGIPVGRIDSTEKSQSIMVKYFRQTYPDYTSIGCEGVKILASAQWPNIRSLALCTSVRYESIQLNLRRRSILSGSGILAEDFSN